MKPFYLEGKAGQIFCVYDPPQGSSARDSIVVLCHPHGQEYFYAFRAYRTLATGLAKRGFHVFRFDYFGTGDSAGDADQVSLHQWISDVVAVVDEARGLLGHLSVSLVGLRLGGTLAGIAASQCREVDRLALWQPVINGTKYVATLQAHHQEWLQTRMTAWSQAQLLPADDELLGSRFTQSLRTDLERTDLGSLTECPADNVLIVNQDDDGECGYLAERLRKLGAGVELKRVEDQMIWSMLPDMQWGLVPNRVLKTIITWLGSPVHE